MAGRFNRSVISTSPILPDPTPRIPRSQYVPHKYMYTSASVLQLIETGQSQLVDPAAHSVSEQVVPG